LAAFFGKILLQSGKVKTTACVGLFGPEGCLKNRIELKKLANLRNNSSASGKLLAVYFFTLIPYCFCGVLFIKKGSFLEETE
jgi:hypothetical protein